MIKKCIAKTKRSNCQLKQMLLGKNSWLRRVVLDFKIIYWHQRPLPVASIYLQNASSTNIHFYCLHVKHIQMVAS